MNNQACDMCKNFDRSTNSQTYFCTFCGSPFSSLLFAVPQDINQGCNMCKNFDRSINPKKYSCGFCGSLFSSLALSKPRCTKTLYKISLTKPR